MITAKQIRDKCKKDIEYLQKICNHPHSTWCEGWLVGIGRSFGKKVRLCDVCEKELEQKNTTALNAKETVK